MRGKNVILHMGPFAMQDILIMQMLMETMLMERDGCPCGILLPRETLQRIPRIGRFHVICDG